MTKTKKKTTPPKAAATKVSHPTRGKKLRRDLLSEHELKQLLEACGTGDAAVRNRAFIALIAGTGLRISDVLALKRGDVDVRKKRVQLADRPIWVHPDALAPMQTWMKKHDSLGLGKSPVFCNLEGESISTSYFRTLLPKLAKKAKLTKRVHPDGLRHVFARRAFKAKITMRTVQLQLGHSNVATTLAYMEGLGLHNDYDHFDAAFAS